MLKLKQRRTPEDPGDSGSLNDLSFLLIVFFLVIAGFNINKGFLMDIPDTNKPRVVQSEDLVKCELTKNGHIILEDKQLNQDDFLKQIQIKQKSYPNMTLFLIIDPDTPYQMVIDTIQTVRYLNVDNFSFKMKDI